MAAYLRCNRSVLIPARGEDKSTAPLQQAAECCALFPKATSSSVAPFYRARLAEAGDRVQRVAAVLSTELSRPPPNTVERAVLGKTPRRPAEAGGRVPEASPAFKQVGRWGAREEVAGAVLEVGLLCSWLGEYTDVVRRRCWHWERSCSTAGRQAGTSCIGPDLCLGFGHSQVSVGLRCTC